MQRTHQPGHDIPRTAAVEGSRVLPGSAGSRPQRRRGSTTASYQGWAARLNRPAWIMLITLAHLGCGFIPKGSLLAMGHALGTLGVSLIVVLALGRPIHALYAAAYITGAEVFWRMVGAGVFHEYGKYAVCLVLIAAMVKHGKLRFPIIQVVYFLCLLPAVFMTLFGYEWYTSRRLISQNLSGPVALLICSIFCCGLRIGRQEMRNLLVALILPLSVAALYVLRGMQFANVEWSNESNASMSGGFGPNQVSAMLGLGAFAAVGVCFLTSSLWLRLFMGGICLWLLGQSALTFSRTGIYLVAVSFLGSGVILLRNPRVRSTLLLGGAALVLMGGLVVFPVLNAFTEGRLSARFAETQLSNRSQIASVDLAIWESHLLFGVGIGQAKFERGKLLGEEAAAHTEYTRLLAEHGLPGLVALILLVVAPLLNLFRQRQTGQALCAGFLGWAMAFMLVSAMRLAGPSVLLGLSFANLDLEEPVTTKGSSDSLT